MLSYRTCKHVYSNNPEPFLQVLKGDIKEAICTHALYYAIWKKYEAMPERFNWHTKQPDVNFSPLRPELVESTYLLHQVRPVGEYLLDYLLDVD